MVKVHYFFDPMCGWCYGVTPLVEELFDANGFQLIYHPGGMLPRKAIEHSFRQHILRSDKQIEAETGMKFGEKYMERLNNNNEFVFDSYLPIQALLVGENMGLSPFITLKEIQKAHYQQGSPVHELETLKQIALSLDLEESSWLKQMQETESVVLDTVEESHKLMSQFAVNGYPTLIAEVGNNWIRLPHSMYYQKISEWKKYLNTLI